MYCHLARPSELPPTTDLHLFKSGIRPMWEDPANTRGGKWVCILQSTIYLGYFIYNLSLNISEYGIR